MLFLKRNNNDFDVFNGLSVFSTSRLQTDVLETEDAYELELNVPGVLKDDINISYENQYLTIEIVKNVLNDDKKYLIKEINTSKIKRSHYLPNVNSDSIKASLNNGVLTIKLHKESRKETKNIIIE